MSDRELQVAFHARADHERYQNRMSNPFLLAKERHLARLVAGENPADQGCLLEVGCGEGSNLAFLAEALKGWARFGIDFSEAKIAYLLVEQPGVEAVAGDALHLPFADGSFDLVLCRDLLHHVDANRDQAVSEALRVLRPGGRLVVFESSGRKLLNRVFRLLQPAERGSANSTPASLAALAERHGGGTLSFVECSFLIRALGFVVGWPGRLTRILAAPLYGLAWLWERACEALLPRNCWTYMMLELVKDGAD